MESASRGTQTPTTDTKSTTAFSHHQIEYQQASLILAGGKRRTWYTRIKRAIKGMMGSPSGAGFNTKVMMTAVAALLLSGVVRVEGDVKVAPLDVLAYSAIYCFWIIFCLPDILLSLNYPIIRRVLVALFRLFAVEIGVALYSVYKEEGGITKRLLNMTPVMGGEVQWIADIMYTLRYAVLIGTLTASLVARLFDPSHLLDDYELLDEEEDETSTLHDKKAHVRPSASAVGLPIRPSQSAARPSAAQSAEAARPSAGQSAEGARPSAGQSAQAARPSGQQSAADGPPAA